MAVLGLPSRIGGVYRWPNSVTVQAINAAYNLIYLFVAHTSEAGGHGSAPYGTFRWPTYYTPPNLAEVAAKRAAGVRVVLSLGGAGSHIDLTDRTVSTRLVDSVDYINEQWGGTRQDPVFDGVDLNTFEASALRNTTEYVWVGQELKSRFGSGFMVVAPPSPWNALDRDMCRAMLDEGALDYAAPQWYDGSNAPASVILGSQMNGLDYWVSYVARGDASKIVAGFGLANNNAQTAAYSSWQNIQSSYQTLAGRHPTLRGMFLWDAGADQGLGWPVAQNVLPVLPPDFGGGGGGTPPPPVSLPTVPTSVFASEVTANSARLNWSPPADDGGGSITGYAVSVQAPGWNNGDAWTTTVSGATSSYVFTNLFASTEYTLAVAAVNSAGTGPYATATPTTLAGNGGTEPPPPAPTSLAHVGSSSARAFASTVSVPGVASSGAGDRAIAFVTQNDSGTAASEVKFTPPAGWTEVGTVDNGSTSRTGVYQRLLDAPLGAQTWGAPNTHWLAVGIVVFSGAAALTSFSTNFTAWGTSVTTPAVESFAGDVVLRYGHGTAGGPGAIGGTAQVLLNQLPGASGIAHFAVFVGESATHTYTATSGSATLRGIALVVTPAGTAAQPPTGLTVQPISGGLRASWSSTLSEFVLQRERWVGGGTPS